MVSPSGEMAGRCQKEKTEGFKSRKEGRYRDVEAEKSYLHAWEEELRSKHVEGEREDEQQGDKRGLCLLSP